MSHSQPIEWTGDITYSSNYTWYSQNGGSGGGCYLAIKATTIQQNCIIRTTLIMPWCNSLCDRIIKVAMCHAVCTYNLLLYWCAWTCAHIHDECASYNINHNWSIISQHYHSRHIVWLLLSTCMSTICKQGNMISVCGSLWCMLVDISTSLWCITIHNIILTIGKCNKYSDDNDADIVCIHTYVDTVISCVDRKRAAGGLSLSLSLSLSHTYTHTHAHTHTNTHTYIIDTYINPNIHTYVHMYIYIHTYVHTYIHTYIHTYTHAYKYMT